MSSADLYLENAQGAQGTHLAAKFERDPGGTKQNDSGNVRRYFISIPLIYAAI